MESSSTETNAAWRPSASIATLRARADLVRRIRAFFDARAVLEVETPLLSRHATVDRHIESFRCVQGGWLHTSPEFAMKRLLCAGSGPIWQLCKVFRFEESGRLHNPEFSLLEWYRPGFDHHALMAEVEALLRDCGVTSEASFERLTYRDAFLREAGFDPFVAPASQMREAFSAAGQVEPRGLGAEELTDRDLWLDLWMSGVVAPQLGRDRPCFLYDFPASQAALARVRDEVAERFELIWNGVELANGFHELADAAEQERRFLADRAWRAQRSRIEPPHDAELIAALHQGLPDCAGVALGIDRLLQGLLGLPTLAETLAFDSGRA